MYICDLNQFYVCISLYTTLRQNNTTFELSNISMFDGVSSAFCAVVNNESSVDPEINHEQYRSKSLIFPSNYRHPQSNLVLP